MDRRVSGFTLVAAVTLAACSPDLVAPPNAPTSLNLSRNVSHSGRHIVLLNPDAGASFAARVKSLGGTVESYHAGAGLAIVSKLTDQAVSELRSVGSNVQSDFQFSLELPVASVEAAASDAVEVENGPNEILQPQPRRRSPARRIQPPLPDIRGSGI